MMRYQFGDIVLIAFPFTNRGSVKKRPALVLLDTEDNDLLLSRVTSQMADSSFDVQVKE
ncbi:MAG: hypothetical protein AAF847_10370 [Bacteroidota bacterium]